MRFIVQQASSSESSDLEGYTYVGSASKSLFQILLRPKVKHQIFTGSENSGIKEDFTQKVFM